MNVQTKIFIARFSAVSNQWTITTDKMKFSVDYLKIDGFDTGDKRLANSYQEIKGEDVLFIIGKNHVAIKKWNKLKKRHLWDGWNPDQPRNLAKSVTVS